MSDKLKQIELLDKEFLAYKSEVNDRSALSAFFGFIAGMLFGMLLMALTSI